MSVKKIFSFLIVPTPPLVLPTTNIIRLDFVFVSTIEPSAAEKKHLLNKFDLHMVASSTEYCVLLVQNIIPTMCM